MNKSDVHHEESAIGGHPHITKDDLNNNLDARISNPLQFLTKDQLLADVDNFCSENGLGAEQEIIRKGALVAQNPQEFENIGELSSDDVAHLREEVTHRWRHPSMLYFAIVLCSIGSAVQGWDQTGSNGANLSFPQEFGIGSESDYDTLVVGAVNASPYIASAVLGVWLCDPFNTLFGRRATIFVSAILCIVGPLWSGFCVSWRELFMARFVMGLGMGLKGSTIPIYAAESAPTLIRGALVMSWQLWTAFGIFLGFCANLVFKDVGKNAWRFQLASALVPAVPLAAGIFFIPESPRWLVRKGRYAEAYASLLKFRNSQVQAARDLYAVHAQVREETLVIGPVGNPFSRFVELWTIPRNRRAAIASGTVMLAQQLCGINIIAFYSSTIFVKSGATATEALAASTGFGALNFVFAIPALFLMDTFGRRSLLLAAFPAMAFWLLATGLFYIIPETSKAHLGLVALGVYLYSALYSASEGPVPFAYSAEVHALRVREVGMSWAVATCLGWASVLSLTFPRMLVAFGVTGSFIFYAGTNLLALFLIFLFVPETKQLSMEELDFVFATPHRVFIRYQFKEALPHWFKTKILRQRLPPLEPLFRRTSVASSQLEK
ncbi:hypothetical protein PYCC9005_005185 [Savitreella phatthalungensis]